MDGSTFWSAVGAIGTCVATIVAVLAYRGTRPPAATPPSDLPPVKDPPPPEETQQGKSRREETLSVLFRLGVVTPGTEIEPMPQALPAEGDSDTPNTFRVRIGRPPGREVIWAVDNNAYSLTALSNKLSDEHGLQWFRNRTFELWRLVGKDESLWDMAERLLQREEAG